MAGILVHAGEAIAEMAALGFKLIAKVELDVSILRKGYQAICLIIPNET
ncbi:MAG: hypothetical protein H7A53_05840 [Akkermansiaceae bacterium]|nr:hypothetical protein [Akkermansiaceae bacterium]